MALAASMALAAKLAASMAPAAWRQSGGIDNLAWKVYFLRAVYFPTGVHFPPPPTGNWTDSTYSNDPNNSVQST